MYNVFEDVLPPRLAVRVAEIKNRLVQCGALGANMSGSGPTVFGLFVNPQAARRAYESLRFGEASGLARQVYLTNFFNTNGQEGNSYGK